MTSDDEAVEAVAQALLDASRKSMFAIPVPLDRVGGPDQFRREAAIAIAALDRVRSRPDSGTERLMCTEHEDRKAIAYTARCAECSREFMSPGSGTEPDTAKLVEARTALLAIANLGDGSGRPNAWQRIARNALAGFSVDAGEAMTRPFRLDLEGWRSVRGMRHVPAGCIVYALLASGQPSRLVRHNVRCLRGTLACGIDHRRGRF